MRAQGRKRALRYMPPIIGGFAGTGVACVFSSVRAIGMGPGTMLFRMMDLRPNKTAIAEGLRAARYGGGRDLTWGIGSMVEASRVLPLYQDGQPPATEERQLPEVKALVASRRRWCARLWARSAPATLPMLLPQTTRPTTSGRLYRTHRSGIRSLQGHVYPTVSMGLPSKSRRSSPVARQDQPPFI